MRPLLPATALMALMLTGCCTSLTTVVRNNTGRDITLTASKYSGSTEIISIRAGGKGRLGGVMPTGLDRRAESWTVSDGDSNYVFADVSPIAAMPSAFISSSRFTRDFPCRRMTQHVRLAPDMSIHAIRVVGHTAQEPIPFPIRFTRKEDKK